MSPVEVDVDELAAVRDVARKIMERPRERALGPRADTVAWGELVASGMASLGVPEEHGGTGGTLAHLAEVVRAAGATLARVPIVEAGMAGTWLAAECGRRFDASPVVCVDGSRLSLAGQQLAGVVPDVAWFADAGTLLVLCVNESGEESVLPLAPAELVAEHGTNLVGEPRSIIRFSDIAVGDRALTVSRGTTAELRLRAALGRALLVEGALGTVLQLTCTYAAQREQFGKPISRFQAVQQQVAELAADVALAGASTEAAVVTALRSGFAAPQTFVAVAAAKIATSRAATIACRIGHQVHGALGFTQEYPLQHSTRALWAWRDEAGSETWWQEQLGRASAAARLGPWDLVSG
jgi:acyl-CoA dehydrogenase